MRPFIPLLTVSLILCSPFLFAQPNQPYRVPAPAMQKNQVIILTDIGTDPDDSESMVRLLLYCNEIEIKGLIATTSVWQKTTNHPDYIRSIIRAYGKVQPNLNKNEPGYPTAESLLKKVTHGITEYGMQGVGKGKDSPGSRLILKAGGKG